MDIQIQLQRLQLSPRLVPGRANPNPWKTRLGVSSPAARRAASRSVSCFIIILLYFPRLLIGIYIYKVIARNIDHVENLGDIDDINLDRVSASRDVLLLSFETDITL
jgi:hypothetical protein